MRTFRVLGTELVPLSQLQEEGGETAAEEEADGELFQRLVDAVPSASSLADLEQRVPQVRDMTILLLASKRLSELSDFEGKALLKEDLRERVGSLLAAGTVDSVMFTEFVVQ